MGLTMPESDAAAAIALYNVDHWGRDYFTVNEKGNVCVLPTRDPAKQIDLMEIVEDARERGFRLHFQAWCAELMRHVAQPLLCLASLPYEAYVSLSAFALRRAELVALLQRATAEDWQRTGEHEVRGPISLSQIVASLVEHEEEHCAQIETMRAKLR